MAGNAKSRDILLIREKVCFNISTNQESLSYMKILIERAKCVGNARCAAVSDRLYLLDDDGYIDSEGFDVPSDDEKSARNGAKACPERIIHVIEDDGSVSWPPAKMKA